MKSTEIRSQIVTLWFNIFGSNREPDPYSLKYISVGRSIFTVIVADICENYTFSVLVVYCENV